MDCKNEIIYYIIVLNNIIMVVKCEFDGCEKIPNYNFKGETKARFCASHKEDGMLDIKHKMCEFDGCETRANFGLPGNKATRCKTHVLEGMIPNPKKKCFHEDCKEIAIYGIGYAKFCEKHKEENSINLIEKKCKSCGFLNILDKKGMCYTCDPNVFNTVRLAKQKRVKDFLDANGMEYESYDKIIPESCAKERPDFLFLSKSKLHYVILEVDENQHKDRPEQCECTRMVNISQSLTMPTIFIRYNPDKFSVKRVKKDPSHNERMKILKEILNYAIELKNDDLTGYCSYRNLFFDGWKKTDVIYNPITNFEKEN